MGNINPIATAQSITGTYGRYLKSLVQPRQKALAEAIAKAIDDSIANAGGIVKGPYLEATPPYVTGKTVRQLVAEGVLAEGFLKLGSNSFPLDRPVYAHQEEAIRKVHEQRNLLVATGTGSGKTESFLIPIINHLLREKESGTLGPGVRALLLYPMNALANDQVKRIREILEKDTSITFGRYTGETLETLERAKSVYVHREGRAPASNELISREQMRETPPHILLTNYAMLEYLLLRPEDHEIFGGTNSHSWRFIVADEAHTYDGAHGVEVALLLQKLRERVDSEGSILTIGTTATIGGDDAAKEEFAKNFFGNKYQIASNSEGFRDLVEPQRRELPVGTWSFPSPAAWLEAGDEDSFVAAAARCSPSDLAPAEKLLSNNEVARLRKFLMENPASIEDCAEAVFGNSSDISKGAVVQIVELGTAVKDEYGNPSFQARFHLFARATEGVFSCLSESPHAQLSRHLECPECDALSYELAGCKRCGGSYFAGHVEESEGRVFFRPGGKTLDSKPNKFAYPVEYSAEGENEDEINFDEPEAILDVDSISTGFLCRNCGLVTQEDTDSCASCNSVGLLEVRFTEKTNVCQVCAGRGLGIIRRLESGNDAAAAVLATSLYQDLPPAPMGKQAHLPGEGRKLMIFSDSRQQAAFFAPYLEDSYDRIVWRRLLLKALRAAEAEHPNSEIGFLDLRSFASNAARSANLLEDTSDIAQHNEVLTRLYWEAMSTDLQNNLEGTGYFVWKYKLPTDASTYKPLVDIGFSANQARDFVSELLNSLRTTGIVAGKPGVDLSQDIFKPRTGPLFIRERESNVSLKTYSWLPKTASNTRVEFAKKVFARLSIQADPSAVLSGIWAGLTNPNGLLKGVLSHETRGAQGVLYSLNPEAVLIESADKAGFVHKCDLCRRVSAVSVAGACPRFKCQGSLVEIDSIRLQDEVQRSHYAELYDNEELVGMRTSEHTAQLETDYAAVVQQDFIEGRVNVLSSSTTFELGVDVGELQAVLLRNMPPTVANYIQRAGRAGRRADSAALILTYAQRRPHDLSMFGDPVSMVAGKMRAPYVDLHNERILQRHIFSLFFSAFFKDLGIKKLPKTGDFLSGDAGAPGELVLSWVNDNLEGLRPRFEAIVPQALKHRSDELWVSVQQEFSERYKSVSLAFKEEVAAYLKLIEDLSKGKDGKTASAAALHEALRLNKSLRTILDKDLIGFLSKNNLIPKYGFPVDTVPLVPRRGDSGVAKNIELDRDLSVAIFDYAPGAQVIAAGYLWESVGLVLPANTENEFPKARYAKCKDCEEYQERIYIAGDSITRCQSCGSNSLLTGSYVIPLWGFHARGGHKKPGDSIKRFAWNRSIHLKEHGTAVVVAGNRTPIGVKAELRTVAKLVIINSGPANQGYQLCSWCNSAHPTVEHKASTEHERPYDGNKKCNRTFWDKTDLGHEFQTDIVHLTLNMSRFGGNHKEAARSLSFALLEGASEGLQIAHDDIDVVCLPSSETEIRLALIDAVPGGAGFAKMIAERLVEVFESAYDRVARCECGQESSCYQCLRSFRNQREHEDLVRGQALDVLKFVLGK